MEAIFIKDRIPHTLSNHAYPVGGIGIGVIVLGVTASSVATTVAGIFFLTIAALARYLYPSFPDANQTKVKDPSQELPKSQISDSMPVPPSQSEIQLLLPPVETPPVRLPESLNPVISETMSPPLAQSEENKKTELQASESQMVTEIGLDRLQIKPHPHRKKIKKKFREKLEALRQMIRNEIEKLTNSAVSEPIQAPLAQPEVDKKTELHSPNNQKTTEIELDRLQTKIQSFRNEKKNLANPAVSKPIQIPLTQFELSCNKEDAFYDAVRIGDESNCIRLIREGLDPSRVSKYGENILHFAIRMKKERMVMFLIPYCGRLLNVKNSQGHTPYMHALSLNLTQTCKDLYNAGALPY